MVMCGMLGSTYCALLSQHPSYYEYSPPKNHPLPPQALAEKEGDGMAKLIYRSDTGEILGVWIIGLHAADLIHEMSNAVATRQTIQDIRFAVHAHPTLSEVLEELIRGAHVEVKAAVKSPSNKTPVAA